MRWIRRLEIFKRFAALTDPKEFEDDDEDHDDLAAPPPAPEEKRPFAGTVLLRFFTRETRISTRRILFYTAIAGLSNALILGVINAAAEHVSDGQGASLRYLLMFLVVLGIYNLSQRYIFISTTQEVERIIHKYRTRIVSLVRKCDLDSVENIGRSFIFGAVTRQPQVVSQTAGQLVLAAQSAILIVFTLIYMAILSRWAFYLSLGFLAMSILVYQRKMKETNLDLHKAIEQENVVFDGLTDVIDGFKEVRLHADRSQDLAAFVRAASAEVTRLKVRVDVHLSTLFVFAQTCFYLLAAALVFLLPLAGETYSAELLKTVTVVMFLIGPISSVVGSSNNLVSANAACEDMLRLEETLKKAAKTEDQSQKVLTDFSEIRLDQVTYAHEDEQENKTFSVGPCDLSVKKGEMIFVSGGNGSGKSTLMKLLVALYHPASGRIMLDGNPLTQEHWAEYQSLFSTVFFDFHLFPRTYGLDVDTERLDDLLQMMGIKDKTHYADGKFDTLRLSTGQRKRLALIIAILEDRPIYMFDEWAADQDPQFRQNFYETILPDLRARGKTIIAVTHDDRYFDHCDRRIIMDEGKITDLRKGRANG
ncbi:cyclic peptide export ABC transporter [Roseovarius aestuarii]|nr:cyclic peptide export ABC transporter [Roseovarius aestuarii]